MAATETSEIRDALAWVEEEFPFEGYITEGSARGIEHVVRVLLRYVNLDDGLKLLDIGCGPMDKTAVLSKMGIECCTVDDLSDPWHLCGNNREIIKDFASRAGINFFLQAPEDYSIPFPKEHFDIVTCMAVIEHLHESPRELLNAAGEHLKPEGILCLTMPNSVNLRKRVSVLLGRTNYPPAKQFFNFNGTWRGHIREYTLAETVTICQMAGFEVLSATTFEGIAYDKLQGLKLRAFCLLCQIFPKLRPSLCVIARKPTEWSPCPPNTD